MKKKTTESPLHVWCCDDDKYGTLSIHKTKESAEKWVEENGWHCGYGGEITKRRVKE